MRESKEGRPLYKVRGEEGEAEWVDHDELWRRQQRQVERLRRERERRRRLLIGWGGGALVLALVAAVVLLVRLGGSAAGPSADGRPELPESAAAGDPAVAAATAAAGGADVGPGEPPGRGPAAAVRGWAEAWSRQEVAAYLEHYSERFEPAGGLSRGAWERQRRRRVSSPASIEVEITELEIVPLDGDLAEVRFRQSYRSPDYADVVRKRLTLARERQGWRITREAAEPLVGER